MAHPLFTAGFPARTHAEWRFLVQQQAGALPDLQTPDGIAIAPLYPAAQNAAALPLRAGAGAWAIAQRLDHPDAATANSLALTDLNNGANSLVLVAGGTPAARSFGLPAFTKTVLGCVLQDISLDAISLRLDAGGLAAVAAQAFADHVAAGGLPPGGLDMDFGIDPLGAMAWRGGAADLTMLEAAAHLAPSWKGSRTVLADGRPYHEAGMSPAQELAHVLATALFYLRAFEVRGFGLDAARRSIGFLLVADTDFFLTLAKFRALRFLWASVEESCGLPPLPIRLHAETGWTMMERRGPHGNIVRTAIAATAAALGGADAIAVLPFTLPLEIPGAEARRLARNSQTILQREAHLSQVADPAAGAGAFEGLTQDLCARAWEIFQAIEAAGGMLKTLTDRKPRERAVTECVS